MEIVHTAMPTRRKKQTVARLSFSLPPDLARELDALVAARGFGSRSRAISSMIRDTMLEHRREGGTDLMMGSITLFFKQTRPGLLVELAALKRRCVDEVVGSLQVQLERDHLMEVIVVQGPAAKLQRITDELVACKGVKAGKLTLTTSLIPPVHPLPGAARR
jgi:CopG family nickel-responsive transcriptional regulator